MTGCQAVTTGKSGLALRDSDLSHRGILPRPSSPERRLTRAAALIPALLRQLDVSPEINEADRRWLRQPLMQAHLLKRGLGMMDRVLNGCTCSHPKPGLNCE